MNRLLVAAATIAAVLATATAAGGSAFPTRIELPDGFQPEGIDIVGTQFYVGSIPSGSIYRGDLRTGEGDELREFAPGSRAAAGVDVERGLVFVAGGGTGMAFVYDARTGDDVVIVDLSPIAGTTFINDVVVTKDAAWFTDSQRPVLYRLPLAPNGEPNGAAETVALGGDYLHAAGFNLNGIDATPNGKTLVVVQSNTGNLYALSADGVADRIELTDTAGAPESVPMGDGILLDGKTLYVVQNRLNLVATIALSPDLASGVVLSRTGNADFDVPTTIAEHGSRLYAVNARFRMTPPEPPLVQPADYWITQFSK
jgi:sugar lactone lactonase YvrE